MARIDKNGIGTASGINWGETLRQQQQKEATDQIDARLKELEEAMGLVEVKETRSYRITMHTTGKHIDVENTKDSIEQIFNVVKLLRPNEDFTVKEICTRCDEGRIITKWEDDSTDYPQEPTPAEWEYCKCKEGEEAEAEDLRREDEAVAAEEARYEREVEEQNGYWIRVGR